MLPLYKIGWHEPSSLCKYGEHCQWIYLTTLLLDFLVTSLSCHNGSEWIILLNWLLFPFSNFRVPLVQVVYIGVKPVRIISGGVGTPPAIHRGVEPICWISYGLFSHTNVHGCSPPIGILGVSKGLKSWKFTVHPGRCNFWSLIASTQCHKSHGCLFSWIFISCFCRS